MRGGGRGSSIRWARAGARLACPEGLVCVRWGGRRAGRAEPRFGLKWVIQAPTGLWGEGVRPGADARSSCVQPGFKSWELEGGQPSPIVPAGPTPSTRSPAQRRPRLSPGLSQSPAPGLEALVLGAVPQDPAEEETEAPRGRALCPRLLQARTLTQTLRCQRDQGTARPTAAPGQERGQRPFCWELQEDAVPSPLPLPPPPFTLSAGLGAWSQVSAEPRLL